MTETPALINWALRLTPEGEAVAAYMDAQSITFTPEPAPKNSLVRPVARWFAAHPDDAADLWRQYAEQGDRVSA